MCTHVCLSRHACVYLALLTNSRRLLQYVGGQWLTVNYMLIKANKSLYRKFEKLEFKTFDILRNKEDHCWLNVLTCQTLLERCWLDITRMNEKNLLCFFNTRTRSASQPFLTPFCAFLRFHDTILPGKSALLACFHSQDGILKRVSLITAWGEISKQLVILPQWIKYHSYRGLNSATGLSRWYGDEWPECRNYGVLEL